ncbi:MAG: butyrate kinase [Spirochaetes bacterium]|nr:butyrate kinase [Spirochaetota bacterium]MBU1079154.1 butyrate kinase [Spirochaetota bacterium]
MPQRILVINPGSTSTKIAVYEDGVESFSEGVAHSAEEIAPYSSVAEQIGFRLKTIRASLSSRGLDMSTLSCIVGRGGLLKPIQGGVYAVSEAMKDDLRRARYGEHASNLGALIADQLAVEIGVPAFIADPVVVDELSDVARIAGHRLFRKQSIFHALNQKAVARRWASENAKRYEDVTLIVAHMGGGVSVGLHSRGRVVDVNNALNGEGPFSPERSGTLPAGALAKLCFSGTVTEKEVMKMINGQGGIVSLAGTNDMRVLEAKRDGGDAEAGLVYEAFIYNVGKAIGALAAAADGKVDGIVLTGGIAYGKPVQEGLSRMAGWIAPITVYPGEGELEALAAAGERGLAGEAKEYS